MKKLKEQTNIKLKMADTRKRLYNFISKIQSFDANNSNHNYCNGRTVKEMTVYFENMSKLSSNVDLDPSKIKTQLTITQKPIPMFRKSTIPCMRSKTPILRNYNSARKDLNLHSVWKDSKLYGKSIYSETSDVSRSNLMGTLKHTLKSSLLNCVLMLQYIV